MVHLTTRVQTQLEPVWEREKQKSEIRMEIRKPHLCDFNIK